MALDERDAAVARAETSEGAAEVAEAAMLLAEETLLQTQQIGGATLVGVALAAAYAVNSGYCVVP